MDAFNKAPLHAQYKSKCVTVLAAISPIFSDSLLSSLTVPVLSTLVQGSRDLTVTIIMKDDFNWSFLRFCAQEHTGWCLSADTR